MLCLADRKRFLADLRTVSTVVPRRDIKPILQNVRASFRDGALALEATDLELGVRLATPLRVIGSEAPCLLPPGPITAALKAAKAKDFALGGYPDEVRLKVDEDMIHLPGGDPEEFPTIPAFPDRGFHTIDADWLVTALERVSFAASDEQVRYAMNGTKLELNGEELRLVATDGRRLAVAEIPSEDATDGQLPRLEDAPVIVPTKAAKLLAAVLRGKANAKVCVGRAEVWFAAGDTLVYSRLVEGRYPQWREVLPKKKGRTYQFNAGLMLEGLQRVKLATDAKAGRCLLTWAEASVHLECKGEDRKMATTVPCAGEGKPCKVAFDPLFLIDWLKVLPWNGQVTVALHRSPPDKNAKKPQPKERPCDLPALFTFPGCQYVVMPLT